MEYIFREMIKQCDKQISFKGYRLLAVDGSDIWLTKNKIDNNLKIVTLLAVIQICVSP